MIRSTMLPGSMSQLVVPLLEKAGGRSFDVVYHPEFLREGTAVADFEAPPKIVIGETMPRAGDRLADLYAGLHAPLFRVSYEVAELVKYCDNAFHALKVTFANEIGQLCCAKGIDAARVMEVFCSDTKLNLSPYYLRPGFAFGGSCLPKDLRALLHFGHQIGVTLPVLSAILPSNAHLVAEVLEMILATGVQRVGFHGLAFKAGTDDIRESPLVELAKRLIGEGIDLVLFDPAVLASALIGSNAAHAERSFVGRFSRLLTSDLNEVADCGLIVCGHVTPSALVASWLADGKTVLDLANGPPRFLISA